jgi:hypothetical protein
MQQWLPWAMLIVIVLLFGAAPWHKIDPKHEFILSMLEKIAAPDLPQG